MKISAIVHTRNSQTTLAQTLSTIIWVDDLIVVDMESSDDTIKIAKSFKARLFHQPLVPRVDGIRNKFLEKADGEWILVLDSDEYLAADGQNNIKKLLVTYSRSFDAFAIPRFNQIAGQVMRGSDWYPDHQTRLFRKDCVRWSDTNHQLPEVITGDHRLMELRPPDCLHIHHNNYADIKSFIRKQLDYALNDVYDSKLENFDFSDYMARAYENLALHNDPQKDGDLSHALSLLMAWDAVVRGIIHWESLTPRPPLAYLRALPMVQGKVSRRKILLRKLSLRHYATAYVARRLLGMVKGILRIKH